MSSPQFAPRRALGRTGFVVTALGIGDLADRSLPLDTCVATARRAIDAGLNVIDTAPGYEDGYSEQIVGLAVRGIRDQIFVIDKIDALAAPVGPQIDASLQRLQLDHADAFVFHGLSSMPMFEQLSRPGGGFEQLAECIKAGKARFAGISSHHPDVLRAAITAGLCDIVRAVLVEPRSGGIGTQRTTMSQRRSSICRGDSRDRPQYEPMPSIVGEHQTRPYDYDGRHRKSLNRHYHVERLKERATAHNPHSRPIRRQQHRADLR